MRGGAMRLYLAAMLVAIAMPVHADTPLSHAPLADTQLPDPAQEAKARALMHSLRCVVCQGQSIADSDADMAAQMRAMVRRRIRDGESPQQIKDWLVARYGDYVTYDPPFDGLTAPLWIAPLVLLIAGGWLARMSFKRRRR